MSVEHLSPIELYRESDYLDEEGNAVPLHIKKFDLTTFDTIEVSITNAGVEDLPVTAVDADDGKFDILSAQMSTAKPDIGYDLFVRGIYADEHDIIIATGTIFFKEGA